MLNLQLCVLGHAPGFDKLKERVMEIAAALEEQSASRQSAISWS